MMKIPMMDSKLGHAGLVRSMTTSPATSQRQGPVPVINVKQLGEVVLEFDLIVNVAMVMTIEGQDMRLGMGPDPGPWNPFLRKRSLQSIANLVHLTATAMVEEVHRTLEDAS